MFSLHERLQQDCIELGDFPLCRLLLMNNASVPWFILVPRVEGSNEIFKLSSEQKLQLLHESDDVSFFLHTILKADKLNIATLGNMVPQLHIHHIARYTSDPCWPKPVWGNLPENQYDAESLGKMIGQVQRHLQHKGLVLSEVVSGRIP